MSGDDAVWSCRKDKQPTPVHQYLKRWVLSVMPFVDVEGDSHALWWSLLLGSGGLYRLVVVWLAANKGGVSHPGKVGACDISHTKCKHRGRGCRPFHLTSEMGV